MFSDSVLEKLWDSYLIETPVPCDGERGERGGRGGEHEAVDERGGTADKGTRRAHEQLR